MPIFQSFNKRTGAWVKYELYGNKSKILDVKQKNPSTPFKNVAKRGKGR